MQAKNTLSWHLLRREVLFLILASIPFVVAETIVESGFGLGMPFYETFEGFTHTIMRVVVTVSILVCCILPIPFVRKFEGYILTFTGTYLALNHLFAPILRATIFSWFAFLFGTLLVILSGGAAFLSMNEKFRDLFLSIGSGYILSAVLYTFFGFKNMIMYIVTFLIFSLALQILKKPLKVAHYAICKASILSFVLLIALDQIPFTRLLVNMFGLGSVFGGTMFSFLAYLIFAAAFAFIFVISFFKGLIPGF